MEPVFNFQGGALPSVMAFTATVLLLFALACVGGYLAARDRMRAARRVGVAAAAVAGAYTAALLGFSAAAKERAVEAGGWKYFCRLDCHLAYSVAGVERSASPGAAREVVMLRVRFDPETMGPGRGDHPLRPDPLRVRLLASDGRAYAPEASRTRAGLTRALRPGESTLVPLAFRLPAGARGERLLLTERSLDTRFLIGHENSFFHPRAAFRLSGTTTSNDRTAGS